MKSVELFVGAGGLGIGVSRAGFEHLAVVEWDKYCCDTVKENQERGLIPMVSWPLFEGDVRDFDFATLEGKADFVSGGPPCQPFSLGGKHRGPLDKRDMFPQAIRAVREVKPRAFLFENVRGLTRPAFASYLEYVRLHLKHPEILIRSDEHWLDHLSRLQQYDAHGRCSSLHYDVTVRVLNAANYGVPQKRERVFFVGFRSDTGIEWSFPDETHSRDTLLWSQWRTGEYWDLHRVPMCKRPEGGRDKARAIRLPAPPSQARWVTVRDALCDLLDPEIHPVKARAYLNHRFMPGARSYKGHTGSPLDEPAKTLKAGDHGVPGGENMLRRHDGSIRYFSVRESARLQTFPDNFLFHGSWTETMRQLGNAVPVVLAEKIARCIRDHLNGVSRRGSSWTAPRERGTAIQSTRQEEPGGERRRRVVGASGSGTAA